MRLPDCTTQIPIRGQVAWLVSCLEQIWKGAKNDNQGELLNLLWEFPSTYWIDAWERAIQTSKFMPHTPEHMSSLDLERSSTIDGKSVYVVIECVVEVALANAYSEFNSLNTIPHIQAALRVFGKSGLEFPRLENFSMSTLSQDREWGDCVPHCVFYSGFGNDLRVAITLLEREIQSGDIFLRRRASYSLRSLGKYAGELDSIISVGLADQDSIVRSNTADSVNCIKSTIGN